MKIVKILVVMFIAISLVSGCKTVKKITKGDGEKPGIFKAIGGKAGKRIDKYMDVQLGNLSKELENAAIDKETEMIRVTFESGVLFALNSADLGIMAKANITKLATVLDRYSDTKILVEGHTDNTGDANFNQTLSADRAKSVASFLISKGVKTERLSTVGHGSSQPKVDNNSAANRALNRRVEILIYPSETLVKKAKSGKIGNIF